MMRFSRNKNGKKVKEKKLTSKERKEMKLKQSQFIPLFSEANWDLKEILERQGCNLKPKESVSRTSRLVPSLQDTLTSPLALAYFMEFLDTKDLKHLVDFWVAVQAFCVVAAERSRLNSNQYGRSKANGSGSETQKLKGEKDTELDFCDECRKLRGTQDSSNIRLKSKSLQCEHRQREDENSFGDFCSASLNQDSLTNGASKNLPLQSDHRLTNSEEALGHSSPKQDFSTALNFTDTWEPFSSGETKNAEAEGTHVEMTGSKRRNSYVAKRIMSKQTRHRTKSTVVDAVGLYARYISLDADQPIGIPSHIRNQVEAEICRDKNNISSECFSEAQEFVFSKFTPIHQEFLESSHGNKYKLYLLRETNSRLQDILYNETALFYFMEFLDRENCKGILEFWLMAESFEQNVQDKLRNGSYNSDECLEDAMSIYEKYFSMRANHQIIKDDKLRIVIENNICREDGPQPNCFCIPVAYAWTALKEIFFPRFLESDNFIQLLESICKSSVERTKPDEASSTASSDSRSESTEFLATAESIPDFLDKDMDDLWFRPDAGRMAMGYVNPLGVFVTDVDSPETEDEASKASVSKLGKAMKSLWNKETDEEKERLAWEKARKIVEDIQKQANKHSR